MSSNSSSPPRNRPGSDKPGQLLPNPSTHLQVRNVPDGALKTTQGADKEFPDGPVEADFLERIPRALCSRAREASREDPTPSSNPPTPRTPVDKGVTYTEASPTGEEGPAPPGVSSHLPCLAPGRGNQMARAELESSKNGLWLVKGVKASLHIITPRGIYIVPTAQKGKA